jgi:photosystem II stability/assembly factor-like uncharacterized protein
MIPKNIPVPRHIVLYALCCLLNYSCSDTAQWIDQGYDYNHQWKSKVELGFNFTKTYIAPDGSAYAISQQGIVYSRGAHSNTWQAEKLPGVEAALWDINGRGNQVWIIGNDGLILYKKDQQPWVTEKSNADDAELRCSLVSGNDVWVAGSKGTILHRLNENWVREESPDTTAQLLKIGGASGNLWIVGAPGVILHKTGNAPWYKQDCPEKQARLTNLFVQEDEVWAVSNNGIVLHKSNNKPWEPEKLPTADTVFTGVYGWATDIWISTLPGRIFHKKGNGNWIKEIDSGETRALYFRCLYGREKNIWVIGDRTGILHRTENGTWLQEGKDVMSFPLLDIQRSGNEMVAVGPGESIVCKSGNEPWKRQENSFPWSNYSGIYAQGEEVWVSDKAGAILYKNGDEWRREYTDVKDFSILGGYRYGNDVWLVGTRGAILHKSGDGEWLNKAPKLGDIRMEAIYGDKDNIWVVGQQGTVLHKASGDTKFVSEYQPNAARHFTNIKRIGNELWVVGGVNMILHKDINAMVWDEDELPASLDELRQLHYHDICKKGNELWVCGNMGIVLSKKEGGKWKLQTSGKTEADLYRIHDDGNDLLFVGETGKRSVILQRTANNQWLSLDAVESELRALPQSANLYIVSSKGFSYKKPFRNWVHAPKPAMLNVITGAALANDKLYCISDNTIVSLTPDKRQFPIVSRIQYLPVLNGESDSLEIQMEITAAGDQPLHNIRIACDAQPYTREQEINEEYKLIPGSYSLLDSGAHAITLANRFEVTQNFGIVPALDNANKLRIRIHLSSNETDLPFLLKDKAGNSFFTIQPRPWWQNERFIRIALCMLLYYIYWIVMWWLQPLDFIKTYQSNFFTQLVALKPPLKQLLILFDILFPVRKLDFTPHVANAWIAAHKTALIKSFKHSEIANSRSHYVPLPLFLKFPGTKEKELTDRPDRKLADKLFQSKRAIVQIVGPGGAGKTTLAVALGHWLIQQLEEPARNSLPRIPVVVDADTTDLFQTVMDLLTTCLPNQGLPAGFIKYMMKKQRLVIIVDALSERKTTTQEHIKKIHRLLAVNALVITSRREIHMQVKDTILLWPDSLNPKSLVHFVVDCLKKQEGNPVQTDQDQLAFAAKIAALVESNHHNAFILPILVKLIVENALSNASHYKDVTRLIESIPAHIPQVYYTYLLRMNPTHATASNFLHDYQVIDVAESMAKLSLNEKFEPGDFKESAVRELLSKNPQYNGIDVVQRFIDNNIITKRQSLGNFYLRFNLDTLAEYLAASRLYDEYHAIGRVEEIVMKIARSGADATGFKMVFEQVKNYKINNAIRDEPI